jgi:ferredoxin-nitrite reductase
VSIPATNYRLDGIYQQRQEGFYMQRVKLAAGVISTSQARAVAAVSTGFGQGSIHLTSRGSMEIHWLREEDLPLVKREFTKAGLTSRGACGGAVRGVTCASQGAVGFPAAEAMARRIHRHFTANPRFERLPKKFKIGVEADRTTRRHLIQDVGLVLIGNDDDGARFDVYVAGGLGREPQPGFLFESGVGENRIIPLIEAVARVYAAHTPAGKRLKHLIREIGEAEFRRLVALEPTAAEELPATTGLRENLVAVTGDRRLAARVALGLLTAAQLTELADYADRWSDGVLMVSPDQHIAFHIPERHDLAEADAELSRCSFTPCDVTLVVCPGSHECRMGLSATRDVAAALLTVMPESARERSWALSGCPNSCTQPQLADFGIFTSSLPKDDSGERTPRFDLLRGNPVGFGTPEAQGLTLQELCEMIRNL